MRTRLYSSIAAVALASSITACVYQPYSYPGYAPEGVGYGYGGPVQYGQPQTAVAPGQLAEAQEPAPPIPLPPEAVAEVLPPETAAANPSAPQPTSPYYEDPSASLPQQYVQPDITEVAPPTYYSQSVIIEQQTTYVPVYEPYPLFFDYYPSVVYIERPYCAPVFRFPHHRRDNDHRDGHDWRGVAGRDWTHRDGSAPFGGRPHAGTPLPTITGQPKHSGPAVIPIAGGHPTRPVVIDPKLGARRPPTSTVTAAPTNTPPLNFTRTPERTTRWSPAAPAPTAAVKPRSPFVPSATPTRTLPSSETRQVRSNPIMITPSPEAPKAVASPTPAPTPGIRHFGSDRPVFTPPAPSYRPTTITPAPTPTVPQRQVSRPQVIEPRREPTMTFSPRAPETPRITAPTYVAPPAPAAAPRIFTPAPSIAPVPSAPPSSISIPAPAPRVFTPPPSVSPTVSAPPAPVVSTPAPSRPPEVRSAPSPSSSERSSGRDSGSRRGR